jgi:ABC-type polysaccharide/polyol phosphate transport system ATPase subunit
MAKGPLSLPVTQHCDEITGRVGAHTGGQLRQVRAQLRVPLRVATAGRPKAGKSTLVNALSRLLGPLAGPPDRGPEELAGAAFAAANRNAGASPARSRVAQLAHLGFDLLAHPVTGEAVWS